MRKINYIFITLIFAMQINFGFCQFDKVIKIIEKAEKKYSIFKDLPETHKDYGNKSLEIKELLDNADISLAATPSQKKESCSITYYYAVTKLRLTQSHYNEKIMNFDTCSDNEFLINADITIKDSIKLDSSALVKKLRNPSSDDNAQLNKMPYIRTEVIKLNRQHLARIEEFKDYCKKKDSIDKPTSGISKSDSVNFGNQKKYLSNYQEITDRKEDFINKILFNIAQNDKGEQFCNSTWTKRIGKYGEGLQINLYIKDCKTFDTKISQYDLGIIITQQAKKVFDMLEILLKALKDTNYINFKGANLKLTGLADATAFSDGTIDIKYKDSLNDLNEIKNFKVEIIDNNFLFSDYKITDNEIVDAEIGSDIKYNWKLAAIRIYQVYERIITLPDFNKDKIKNYAKVGQKSFDTDHRGVFIEINFPNAFVDLLKLAVINPDSTNLLTYLMGVDSLNDKDPIALANELGIDTILNITERLIYKTPIITDYKYTKFISNFPIPNLIFDVNDSNLLETSKTTLKKIFNFMDKHPSSKIFISGHTDEDVTKSKAEFYIELSQKRAKKCRNYLIKLGISPDRIEYEGYGDTKLINFAKPGEKVVINRRVEIKFTVY